MPTPVKTTELPVATSVASSATMVIVQGGTTYQLPVSLLPNDTSATDVQVSLLRIQVSTQASTLESLLYYGAGPVNLTAVSNTDTEYLATGFYDPIQGWSAYWTPPVTNGGDAYLTWNSTRRRLRTKTGSVLTAGLLQSGERQEIYYDAALNSFVVLGLTLSPRVQSRSKFVGPTATLDFYNAAETSVLSRIIGITSSGGSTSGELTFQVGTTTSGLRTAAQMQSDGDTRFYGRILTAGAYEVYHPDNPPVVDFDDVGEIVEGAAQGFGHEDLVSPLIAPASGVHVPITGFDLNRRGWAGVANSWWDAGPMRIHTAFEVGIKSGMTANFYTGSSTSFANYSTRHMQCTGPAVVKIMKFQEIDDMVISAVVGTLVSVCVSAAGIPLYGQTIIGGGQSWMARAIYTGLAGAFATWVSLGATNPGIAPINAAAGASALLYGAATISTNFWWDQRTDVPGPNALQAASVIADWMIKNPTQPVPRIMIWNYGLNDLGAFTSTGDNTPAIWTASQIKLQDWLDDQITSLTGVSVSLHHFITPLPARKLGTFDEKLWYAMRRCQLDVVATDVRTHRLADNYDLSRIWNNEHHSFYMQARWGARWPYFIENALTTTSYYEGPEIIGFTTISAGEYQVRIQRGYVDVSTAATLQRPAVPAGFGLLPSGSDFIEESVTIASYRWTTAAPLVGPQDDDMLRIFPATAQLGLRLAYPYGSSWEMMQPSRIVRDLRTLLPLKTYHPTA